VLVRVCRFSVPDAHSFVGEMLVETRARVPASRDGACIPAQPLRHQVSSLGQSRNSIAVIVNNVIFTKSYAGRNFLTWAKK